MKRKGERQTKSDCESYDACPSDYNSGVKKFPWRNYYSSKPVKKLLVDIHHGKCCFCETWFAESINLDVEHFRPKAGVRQDLDQKEDELPGYYWLAYRWDNLLLSCNACNRQFKKTLFPLKNPSDRARNHNEDVSQELPLFVDPVGQNPRDYIRFSDDTPVGITPEGKVTIIKLGLCRPGVTGDRRTHLDTIVKVYDGMKGLETRSGISGSEALAKDLRKFIEKAMRPESKFSSMVSDYVGLHPL